jgi:lipopolysaccharide/colanic/teichoic acid biosynthesis glycosyltransferase
MLFVSSVFIFFSGNSIFSVPIFLFFFSLSFIIRHIEITDLKIDINLNKPGSRLLKEVFDYTVATVFILIFSPIYLIVSLVILFSMGWPVIYNQSRVGQNGKVFMLHKFRTMKNVKTNTSVAASEKFRITKVGSFLRKTKIDELPELWNIMRSDMSFVGPRPDVPGYADKLKDSDRVILQLKPGLTGPASLKYIDEDEILSTKDNPKKYNDEVIFPDKVKINKAYMRYWTFILDIKIIIFTVLRKSLKEDYFK